MQGYGYGPGGGMMGSGGFGIGLIGAVFMIVFWILVIVGIVLLIKWLVDQSARGSHPPMQPPSSQAMDTLKHRYARGEITKEEFDQMKKDLE